MTNNIKSPTRLPNALARVISWGYGIGIGFQNRRFDRGIGVTKLDRPVISIGNLSAGGTGKTPMVHWVADELLAMGKYPAIAMRGYKAPPGEMGDEEREHRQALPGIPVAAQPNRIVGLRALFETDTNVDCVILDDGFQHRQLARDVEIVLIDASSPPNADALLPRGYLRDPISSLARADAIVITHREMVRDEELAELVNWIKSQVPGCPIAVASHGWNSAMVYANAGDAWQGESVPIEQVELGKVVGVCAIGNPDGFFRSIERAGWDLIDRLALTDHDPFNDTTINRLAQLVELSNASALCMTRKDWVKVSDRLPPSARFRVIVPELGLVFESGEVSLRALITGKKYLKPIES